MIAEQEEAGSTRISTADVYIIDADDSVRHSIQLLMTTLHTEVRCFPCAEDFLHGLDPEGLDLDRQACLITEVDLPGMSGIDLQQRMKDQGVRLPVIVLASRADVRQAVQALQLGAVDFIEKPFVDQILLARVREALGFMDLLAEKTP